MVPDLLDYACYTGGLSVEDLVVTPTLGTICDVAGLLGVL